jgi:predicted ATPase
MIETKSGQHHPVHLLSSGKKQILLMIAFITRELRPGGVLLIDEPDLHLHVSLRSAFISYVKRMVADLKGQLFLASHAPELWKRFNESQKVRLGSHAEVPA